MTTFQNTPPEMDASGYGEGLKRSVITDEADLKKITIDKLIISVIGDANVGKSATINALTGKKLSSVNPISGWTKEIALYRYADKVLIADTPGLNDTSTLIHGQKANTFVEKNADIILFFVNAASNRTPNEEAAFKSIASLGKPVIIVFNKIDTIDPPIQPILSDLQKRFGDKTPIVPISATKNINIEALAAKIADILTKSGKDLLFAKISKHKDAIVKMHINKMAVAAALIGALPIPGSDIIPLTGLQLKMCKTIAFIYDCEVSTQDLMNLMTSIVTGAVGKALFRQGLKLLATLTPITVVITGAMASGVAASMTYGLGYAAMTYYRSGMKMDFGELEAIYKTQFSAYTGEYINDFKKTGKISNPASSLISIK